MKNLVSKLALRMAEPSSWAGLGATLASVGIGLPAGYVQYAALALSGVCGLVGVALRENPAA